MFRYLKNLIDPAVHVPYGLPGVLRPKVPLWRRLLGQGMDLTSYRPTSKSAAYVRGEWRTPAQERQRMTYDGVPYRGHITDPALGYPTFTGHVVDGAAYVEAALNTFYAPVDAIHESPPCQAWATPAQDSGSSWGDSGSSGGYDSGGSSDGGGCGGGD